MPERVAIDELVMNEVERPGLVRPGHYSALFPMSRHPAATRSFGFQSKAFLPIEPVNEVAPGAPSFPLQQDVDPPLAIADARADDLMHALAQFRTGITSKRLALGGAMLACQGTGPALAVAVTCRHIPDTLFHERWPGNSSDRTS
jgi:hypothetical protein